MSRKDISDLLVVKAYAEYSKNLGKFPYEILSEWTGQNEKVCYRAMERAYKHELIEYGVSLRTGWLTDKAKALLEEE